MALKTYVLLDHLRPTADVFVQINREQRARLNTRPQWPLYLQMTFLDEADEITDYDKKSPTYGQKIPNPKKGENRTIRLKLNSNTPYQEDQIEKEKIPANEKFSPNEYKAVKFIHNTLSTTNPVVQRYLEAYPAFEGFKGYCEEIKHPEYKLYDPAVEIKSENEGFKKRLKAANKIADLDLKEAQDMLIRIYGTFHTPPDNIDACQNALVAYMDQSDEALDDILKEDTTIDDEVTILLGRLVSENKLSFDAIPGQVAKKKGSEWIAVKAIGEDYTPFERQRYFGEFLTSEGGKLLLDDLRKDAGIKPMAKNKKDLVTA